MLQEMWRYQLDSDVISYSAAISAFDKGQQWEQALSLLLEIWRSRLEPHMISYCGRCCGPSWSLI